MVVNFFVDFPFATEFFDLPFGLGSVHPDILCSIHSLVVGDIEPEGISVIREETNIKINGQ